MALEIDNARTINLIEYFLRKFMVTSKIYKSDYLKKLESLRQVFIGIKMLYYSTVPSREFKIHSRYFYFLSLETIKMILGKICVLLLDEYNSNSTYNTVSFKILIKSMLDNDEYINNQSLRLLLEEINSIDEKYKTFRDKCYAHIELNKDNTLMGIGGFNIANTDIISLLDLSQKAYDQLFMLLDNDSSDHMEQPIEELSKKLWIAYESTGLVKKI